MNRNYEDWLKYYENATKEQVIEDMMLDINSIKEKDKEIERLNNIINEYTKWLEAHLDDEFYWFKMYSKLQDLKGADK